MEALGSNLFMGKREARVGAALAAIEALRNVSYIRWGFMVAACTTHLHLP